MIEQVEYAQRIASPLAGEEPALDLIRGGGRMPAG